MKIDKAAVHHWLVRLRRIKTWYLVLIVLFLGLFSAFLLRQNNLGMIDRREALNTADINNEGVREALAALQQYVTAHMNADLGKGVFLSASYQRAYNDAVQRAVQTTNPNSMIYEQVELECQPVFARTGSFPAYTECARQKLANIPSGQDALANLTAPPVDLYHFNFVSPLWSFDSAGVVLALAIFVLLILILRAVIYLTLYFILRFKKKPRL